MGRAKKFFKKVGSFVTDQFQVTQRGGSGDDTINGNNLIKNKLYGEGGDDILKAFGARNELYGGSGDDYLRAIGVSNKMRGDSGHDTIIGLGAHNDMRGGSGNDRMDGIGAYNDMYGDSGHDVMRGLGAYNKMNGGDGDDNLLGLGAYNHMRGGTGNDRIEAIGGVNNAYGEDGDDVIIGVGGVNLLDGGSGADDITALGGVNSVKAGSGDDKITAVGGVNVIKGDAGNDEIVAVGGVNDVFGNSGEDEIVAVGGVNVIDAGTEDDLVVAVGGINKIAGGKGDDVLISAGGINVLDGDQGDDLMIAAGAASVMNGGEGQDVMVGVSALNVQNGEAGDDIMVAIGGGNVQTGGAGNDMLFSQGAAFTLQHGGSGNDLMVANGSLNVQIGEDGDDVAFANGNANIQSGGAGKDLMVASALVTGNIQHGGSGDDVLLARGLGNLQIGAAGGDTMIAYGSANIQFAGTVLGNLPSEIGLMDGEDVPVMPTGETMDLAQEHVEMDDAQDTETNVLIGAGGANVQIGDAADDIGIALGLANLQVLGDGDDIGIAGGIGNLQFGQDGTDMMLAMQSAVPKIPVSATFQSGGNDDDLMVTVINDLVKGVSVGAQIGDAGNDVMGMLSLDHRLLDIRDTVQSFRDDGAATATKKYAAGVFIDGTTLQFGGAGDDMFISAVADMAIRSGGDGDDVFLNVGEGGFAAGGDGDDVMVSGLIPSSLYTGGFGMDAMLDFASYARITFDNFLLDGVADLVTHTVESLLETLDIALDGFDTAGNSQIEELTQGLSALGLPDSPAGLVTQFVTTFDMPAGNNFLGGEGDDVFGIASTSTNAIGGLGNDTFIMHLDAVDGAAVNDAGNGLGEMAEGVRTVLDLIDAQEDSNTNATDEVGGDDVLVLRDGDGVSLDDVTLTLVQQLDAETGDAVLDADGNPVLDLLIDVTGTQSGAEELLGLESDSAVTLTGITDTDSRIESIRLHDIQTSVHDGVLPLQQIDVAAAFDAGAFTLDQPIAATELGGFTSLVSADASIAFDDAISATFDDAKAAFASLADGAVRIADAAVDAVNTVRDIVLPDTPEDPEFTAEQQAHIDQYDAGGAGAGTHEVGELGQFGETRTGDVDPFKANTVNVEVVETTQTLAMSDGSILLLFAVKTMADKFEIHGQRLDKSGNMAGDEMILQTDAVDPFQWEAIALENNQFALRANNYKDAEHKFLATPDGGVIKLQDPADGTFFKNYVKTVTLAGGGKAQIDNIRHAADEHAAAVRVIHPDGTTTTANANFATSNGMRQGDIAALADGGFVVAFQHVYQDRDLFMQIYNEDGSARTGYLNPALNQAAHSAHSEPKLAALADGSFVLVYNKDEGADEIHVIRLSATGEQIGDVHIIEGAHAHPSVAATEDGRVVISYAMPDGELMSVMKLYELDFRGGGDNDLFEGGNGNDQIRGGAGDDLLVGGLGDDLIAGEAGDDFLDGDLGDDTVDGGAGDDILGGGVGDDLLTGGAGYDTFFFIEENGSNFGNDSIADFTADMDLIDLLGVQGIDGFDDLLIVQDGTDTVVKVLDTDGAVTTQKVFLLDGVEVTEEEAQAAADAGDANSMDTEDTSEFDVVEREINTIRLDGVDASSLSEDNFAHAGNTVGEYGTIELDHEGFTVETLQTYDDPVVVAFVKTSNGIEIVEARVSEVNSNSFHIELQEAVHLDHVTATETVSYMVIEKGTHVLSSGAVIEAGTVETHGIFQNQGVQSKETVAFDSDALGADSHVFATINTDGSGSFATARVNEISADGFDVSVAKSENLDFELVQNGTFSDGGAHWEAKNPTGGHTVLYANAAQFNAGNETAFGDSIEQTINTYKGATYAVSLDLIEHYGQGSHDFKIEILDEFGAARETHTATVHKNTVEEMSFEFTATSDGSTLRITNTGASTSISTDGKVDNVSVKEVIAPSESVGFVAFQNGAFDGFTTGKVVADEQALALEDTFDFAQITEVVGTDTAVVRQDLNDEIIFLQEETSRDAELLHGNDDVSFLILDQSEGFFLL